MTRVDRDVIRRFYASQPVLPRPRLDRPLRGFTACTRHTGLGDTLMLSALPRSGARTGGTISIYAPGPSFAPLCAFNPFHDGQVGAYWAMSDLLLAGYDLGGGHFIQRLQRAWGLAPDPAPQPCVVVPGRRIARGRVVLHLGPGGADNLRAQRRLVHPRAREIYPSTREALQHFVHAHRELQFYEIGEQYSCLDDVGDWTGVPLDTTIRRMATCEYFVGINSGPMHLAAALDLKIVTILNFPAAELLVLPALKQTGLIDVEWLYPQSVLLHQDNEGPLVPKFSLRTLEQAFAGEIYPYWSNGYLELIEDEAAPARRP